MPAVARDAADRPNVILIVADDMAVGDLAIFNDGLSGTPRLDALVGESAWFERGYAASPVCAPSRAALLTGHYPHRTGAVTLNQRDFPELTRIRLDELTLAEIMAQNGYATGLIGKWHSGVGEEYHPLRRGFHEFAGFNTSWDIKTYYDYQLDIQGSYIDSNGAYLTDEFTRHAIDFVRRHREESFFLHLAHYAPHRPLSAPEDLIEKYAAKGIDRKTATIYAMIEVMDRGIGEVLDELDALAIRENTIVIFTSDNGPDPIPGERFNVGLRGMKYEIHEGGIRVPFLVNWKGTFEPARRDEIVDSTDVVPTLVELCALKLPGDTNPFDGASFAPLLAGEGDARLPESRFWQWNRGVPMYSHNAAVRKGDWKLVRPHVTRNIPKGESDAPPVLYRLSEDPAEQTDVSAAHPEVRDALLQELDRWCAEVEASRTRPFEPHTK